MKRMKISLGAVVLGLGVVGTLAFAKAPQVSMDDTTERWYVDPLTGEPSSQVEPNYDGCDPAVGNPMCSADFTIVEGLPDPETIDNVHNGTRK